MKINYEKNSIEMTKTEAQHASKVGTNEFKELMELKGYFPDYEITVVQRKQTKRAKTVPFKGFTYEFMKAYIEKHDEEGTIIKEFETKRDKYDGVELKGASHKIFIEVRNWFIEQYKDVFEAQYKAISKTA